MKVNHEQDDKDNSGPHGRNRIRRHGHCRSWICPCPCRWGWPLPRWPPLGWPHAGPLSLGTLPPWRAALGIYASSTSASGLGMGICAAATAPSSPSAPASVLVVTDQWTNIALAAQVDGLAGRGICRDRLATSVDARKRVHAPHRSPPKRDRAETLED